MNSKYLTPIDSGILKLDLVPLSKAHSFSERLRTL
jgi:hypothetical protein